MRKLVGAGKWTVLVLAAALGVAAARPSAPRTVECSGGWADQTKLQEALHRGGSVHVSGSCALGSSQFRIDRPLTLVGPATLIADPDYTGWSIQENSDDVTFDNLTFSNAGINVTGSHDTKRRHVNFTRCVFEHYNAAAHDVEKYAAIAIDPIWKDSKFVHNTMRDIWYGGWAQSQRGNGRLFFGQTTSGNYDMHGLFAGSGLDNTQIEYNEFSQISGNAVKVFGNGLSSKISGYTASGVSISYNTFTLIHRMGIEIQNMTGPNGCTGGCDGFALNYVNAKFAGNFFHTPAFAYTETYAYSIAVMGKGHQVINNAAILDFQGNPTQAQARAGYAFEEPPGTGCCGTNVWNGTAVIQGNVVAGDANPADAKNPGWYAAFVNYGSAAPQLHANNVLCGPDWNGAISKNPNEVNQYNATLATCPAGTGAALYASSLQAAWIPAGPTAPGGHGPLNWKLWATDSIPVRSVEFYLDGGTTPVSVQEVADMNPQFAKDRKWLYHATPAAAQLGPGSHTLTAAVTDVSGATVKISQKVTGIPEETSSAPLSGKRPD